MRRYPFRFALFIWLVLALAACSGSRDNTPGSAPLAVTRQSGSSPTQPSEPSAPLVEVPLLDDYTTAEGEIVAPGQPIAVAPLPPSGERLEPPLPVPTGAPTVVRDTFFEDYGVNPYVPSLWKGEGAPSA